MFSCQNHKMRFSANITKRVFHLNRNLHFSVKIAKTYFSAKTAKHVCLTVKYIFRQTVKHVFRPKSQNYSFSPNPQTCFPVKTSKTYFPTKNEKNAKIYFPPKLQKHIFSSKSGNQISRQNCLFGG